MFNISVGKQQNDELTDRLPAAITDVIHDGTPHQSPPQHLNSQLGHFAPLKHHPDASKQTYLDASSLMRVSSSSDGSSSHSETVKQRCFWSERAASSLQTLLQIRPWLTFHSVPPLHQTVSVLWGEAQHESLGLTGHVWRWGRISVFNWPRPPLHPPDLL